MLTIKKIQGNTRFSVDTYLSAGNQPHSHEVGQADVESFDPHPDDSAQDGLVGKFDFSQNSAFFAVRLAQIDTMIKLKSLEETDVIILDDGSWCELFLDIPFDLLKVQAGVATGSIHAKKIWGLIQ